MLFVDRNGEGIHADPRPKRYKLRLDSEGLRVLRACTFEVYQDAGLSAGQIAKAFGFSPGTVHADLKFLRERRAAGKGPLSLSTLLDEADTWNLAPQNSAGLSGGEHFG